MSAQLANEPAGAKSSGAPAAPEDKQSAASIADLQPVEDAVPAAASGAAATTAAAEAPGTGARPARADRPAASSSSSSSRSSSKAPGEQQASELEEEDLGAAVSGTGYISESDSEGESEGGVADLIAQLRDVLSVGDELGVQLAKPALLPSFDLAGVADLIQSGRARRIIVMCGAGISVSAGIPDFRSPGTGLYSRLQKYNLPYPHAVFEMSFFKRNPKPFFLLAKELFPGNYLPTPTHYFLRLLHDKGLLLRCFTQNIDSLEHQAGLPEEAVVAAHGNFDSARCIRCGCPHDVAHVKRAVFEAEGNACYCKKRSCGGLVKPDIVFFGESLPARFHDLAVKDFPQADLLIVMGTSLVVHPFASLINHVEPEVPRLLINREVAGELTPEMRAMGYQTGFDFEEGTNYRDAMFLGDCDDGVRQLCSLLGWEADLDALVAAGRREFQPEYAVAPPVSEADGEAAAGVAGWQ